MATGRETFAQVLAHLVSERPGRPAVELGADSGTGDQATHERCISSATRLGSVVAEQTATFAVMLRSRKIQKDGKVKRSAELKTAESELEKKRLAKDKIRRKPASPK